MLILGSKSPRRMEMLGNLGIEFVVKTADADESHGDVSPVELVVSLAKRKAEGIFMTENDAVLTADTVVSLDGQILEKPKDREDARKMLTLLSGKRHTVYTGYCIKTVDKTVTGVGQADVYFRSLDERDITWYLDTGEFSDKAGAYGIQGLGCTLVEKIEGDYNSVVGLPLGKVVRELIGLGIIS